MKSHNWLHVLEGVFIEFRGDCSPNHFPEKIMKQSLIIERQHHDLRSTCGENSNKIRIKNLCFNINQYDTKNTKMKVQQVQV